MLLPNWCKVGIHSWEYIPEDGEHPELMVLGCAWYLRRCKKCKKAQYPKGEGGSYEGMGVWDWDWHWETVKDEPPTEE